MAAPKGHKYATGRPKGSTNKATAEIRAAYRQFVEGRISKLDEWMDGVAAEDPGKALDFMLKFSEYFLPKLARTEVSGIDGDSVKITSTVDFKAITDEQLNTFLSEAIKGEQGI